MRMTQKLTSDQLPQLLSWLETHLPFSFKMHQELCSYMDQKFPDLEFFTDQWPEVESVACRVDPQGTQLQCREFYKDLIVGLFGSSEKALISFLKNNDRLFDWNKSILFSCVPNTLWPAIQTFSPNVNVESCYMLRGTPEDIKPLPAPEGMKLSSVSDTAVNIVDSTWKFTGPNSKSFIQELVHVHPSVLMTTEDGRHVGHMVGQGPGIMGILFVLPEFRRKGYAKVIITNMAEKIFQQGRNAYVFIDESNTASMNLHTSVGFSIVPDVKIAWLRHLPKNDCCNNNIKNKCCA